ncbi:hypothetical protein AB0N17_40385 [Streptomyces sp. NPDC051133]|uniref:hypothetical protein n=1 Tax=Streptomyces sp. NPDC051133 TaxID=3155521 RepID=UPI0034426562
MVLRSRSLHGDTLGDTLGEPVGRDGHGELALSVAGLLETTLGLDLIPPQRPPAADGFPGPAGPDDLVLSAAGLLGTVLGLSLTPPAAQRKEV